MDMRAPRIGWPFHPALNSAPTLLLMSTDAPLIWHRRAYRRRWAIDRARAVLGRGPGRCTEAPDTSPPPRARYTPRIRSASVQVPCCDAHQKLPKKAAPSPPRVRRAQRPGESLPRCSRGPGGAHGCTKRPCRWRTRERPPFMPPPRHGARMGRAHSAKRGGSLPMARLHQHTGRANLRSAARLRGV